MKNKIILLPLLICCFGNAQDINFNKSYDASKWKSRTTCDWIYKTEIAEFDNAISEKLSKLVGKENTKMEIEKSNRLRDDKDGKEIIFDAKSGEYFYKNNLNPRNFTGSRLPMGGIIGIAKNAIKSLELSAEENQHLYRIDTDSTWRKGESSGFENYKVFVFQRILDGRLVMGNIGRSKIKINDKGIIMGVNYRNPKFIKHKKMNSQIKNNPEDLIGRLKNKIGGIDVTYNSSNKSKIDLVSINDVASTYMEKRMNDELFIQPSTQVFYLAGAQGVEKPIVMDLSENPSDYPNDVRKNFKDIMHIRNAK